jgi:hypothetical protein
MIYQLLSNAVRVHMESTAKGSSSNGREADYTGVDPYEGQLLRETEPSNWQSYKGELR